VVVSALFLRGVDPTLDGKFLPSFGQTSANNIVRTESDVVRSVVLSTYAWSFDR